tara:strand:+ start:345 stop:755 length:411 start_codon:yes stop_codon:yes gene_type:complete
MSDIYCYQILNFFFTTIISFIVLNSFVFAEDIKFPKYQELTQDDYIKFCQNAHPQTGLLMRRCLGYSILLSLDDLKGTFKENERTKIHEFLKKTCKKSVIKSYGDLENFGTLYPLRIGLCIDDILKTLVEYSKYDK